MTTRQAPTLTSPLESDAFAWLDQIAAPLQSALHKLFGTKGGQQVKNWLNGTPIRHRVHPALIVAPLGAWTTAALLDGLDGVVSKQTQRAYRTSADAAIAFGLVAALPTASAGLADWVDLYEHHRRVGMAHALLNTAAVALYGASLVCRLNGNRGAGQALGYAGFGTVMLSGSIGGDMVYNLGIGAPFMLMPKPPVEWVDVLASDDLPEGKPVVCDVGQTRVMLLRQDGDILAVDQMCTHAGGPLSEGTFNGTEVTCPWHNSIFDLTDGRPVQGPASASLRTFEVHEENGRISVHPSYEGERYP